ncbi:MAG: biopolymer transporter ExbD [Pirellulales bacterium]
MSRKHKKKGSDKVTLNLAAMLDMAFQLLAFFILTFKPAPVEVQVNLRLPPPKPVTVAKGKSAGDNTNSKDVLEGLNSLVCTVMARTDGTIDKIDILGTTFSDVNRTQAQMQAELGKPASTFDQIVVQVDSRLKYEGLMRVIDACTRAKLPDGTPLSKLSFVELPTLP